jgi:formylglycine-generating enzyme
MKLVKTLISVAALLIAGCGSHDLDDKETLDEIIAEAIDEDKLQKRGKKGEELYYAPNKQTPYTGWSKSMYDNGQIAGLVQLKDGKEDGLTTLWYESGQKKYEQNLKGGELDGLQSGWYKNGQKHLELMAKDGKYHGPSTKWYENGQKEGEATFKDGNLDGLATGWHENGQKKIEGNWKDGKKIGIWYEWFNNGQKKSEDDYKDGEGVFGTAFTIRDLALDMLWVNSGTFEMGSPSSEKGRDDEETLHNVTLTDGFYLGKHEVTQAEWASLMLNNPSDFKGANRPVENVSWNDVTSFCEKLTELERKAGRLPAGMAYQLPTEAQWEYACRAGTKTAFSFGDAFGELHRHGNYADVNTDFEYSDKAHNDVSENTSPVGSYKANPWGFHDMHGNVYEWCADWYGDYPTGAVSDPVGPAGGSSRVLRGGSWGSPANDARSATRLRNGPANSSDALGFRLSLRPASQ